MATKFNGKVTQELLEDRKAYAVNGGFPIPKYVQFCETLMPHFMVVLDEAQTTESKYVYVVRRKDGKAFKVRFSSHRPNRGKQLANDCDFYVGKVHGDHWQTTEDALLAVEEFFGVEVPRIYDQTPTGNAN